VSGKRKHEKTSSSQHNAITKSEYRLKKAGLAGKIKQSAVTTMMQQVHNQYQTNLAKKGKKGYGKEIINEVEEG
jgi:hypothetical protein